MDFELTQRAELEAVNFGLAHDSLGYMLANSARVTHTLGNRRYHEFIFRVGRGNSVISISKVITDEVRASFNCSKCEDTGKRTIYDACHACHGEKCVECNFEGVIAAVVPCTCQDDEGE